MNIEFKKDLASNWFKTLQDAFCNDIIKIEKNKTKSIKVTWESYFAAKTTKAEFDEFVEFLSNFYAQSLKNLREKF